MIPKLGLGIFFIVVCLLLAIPGFTNLSKTSEEQSYEDMRDSSVSNAYELGQEWKKEGKVTDAVLAKLMIVAHQDQREYSNKCDSLATKRYTTAAYWFIPGGVLLVIGLIMCSSDRSRQTSIDP